MTTVDSSTNNWVWGLQGLQPCAAQRETCPDVPLSPAEYHPHLRHIIHAYVRASRASSPSPGPLSVKVINGSDGKVVHLGMSSEDTIAKLRAQLCVAAPEWKDLSLALNGKPVMEHQCLRDLGVKEGAMFVTFRRCPGG